MWSGITVTRCTDKVSECGGGTSRSTVLARSSFVPPLTLRPSLPTIVVNVVKRLACDYYHLRIISGQRHTNSEPGPLRHRDFSSIPALDEFQWSCLSQASKLRISDALPHDVVDPMSASDQTRAWVRAIVRSALPPITVVTDRRINVRFVPILLQKSQKAVTVGSKAAVSLTSDSGY
jgi:hypothetical protein